MSRPTQKKQDSTNRKIDIFNLTTNIIHLEHAKKKTHNEHLTFTLNQQTRK